MDELIIHCGYNPPLTYVSFQKLIEKFGKVKDPVDMFMSNFPELPNLELENV
jgi:hypothetical protein